MSILRTVLAPNVSGSDNLFFQKGYRGLPDFEKHYLALREKESRLYPDEIVARLPHTNDSKPNREWEIRANTLRRFLAYLNRRAALTTILEVGCGNGWFAHHLSKIPGVEVLALDINEQELRQGARVFKSQSNLLFLYADIFQFSEHLRFDCIVLASAIQYFPNPEGLITKLRRLLNPRGEIHILDSPFYRPLEIEAARERSMQYFCGHNSSLKDYYFHHSWNAIRTLNAEVRYNPQTLMNRVMRLFIPASPFPWIRIRPAKPSNA